MLWVRIPLRRCVLDTTLCDTVCQWLAEGLWFAPGTPVSSTNKADSHDITEILLKVVLNTITITLTRLKESRSSIFFLLQRNQLKKNTIYTYGIHLAANLLYNKHKTTFKIYSGTEDLKQHGRIQRFFRSLVTTRLIPFRNLR
jgi:hypothetical protein